jgi:GT2 family glycosyltransferase
MSDAAVSRAAVVIVSYNTCRLLEDCLHSVVAESPIEVVVVDNASLDGSADMVATRFPRVQLLRNQYNVGYGRAAHQGIQSCATPFVLLLNADTRLQPGALDTLTTHLEEHPSVALVGPRLVDEAGRVQSSQRSYPAVWELLLDWTHAYPLIGKVPVLKERFPRVRAQDRTRRVPWVVGAALAIRRDAYDAVGGFDRSFFLYYEEVDLCYRLAQAGWDVHFTPVAEVVHVGGASANQWPTHTTVQLYRGLAQFYERHYTSVHRKALTVLISCLMLARLARAAARWGLTSDPHARRAIGADALVCVHLLQGDWRKLAPG